MKKSLQNYFNSFKKEELPVKESFFIAIYIKPDFSSDGKKIKKFSAFEYVENTCERIYYYPNN